MAKSKTREYAFLVKVTEDYGVLEVVASVVRIVDGEIRNLDGTFPRDPKDREMADARVSAYVEKNRTDRWGEPVFSYTPFRIDSVERAREIARVLTRVATGKRKAESESGYLDRNDFAGHLIRYAAILGISAYYVQQPEQARVMSGGMRYRPTDGAGLQYWVSERRREIGEGFILG